MTSPRATIVWAESPELHPYLRETTIFHPHRRARPGKRWVPGGGLLVAYSVLPDDASAAEFGSRFRRQVWWLSPADQDPDGPYDAGYWPAEGVDPMQLVGRGVAASRHPGSER